jgi:2-polyprenyl-3-methyl-5-hydroxy-6-metoxy-1,4-benzoquinol methylase
MQEQRVVAGKEYEVGTEEYQQALQKESDYWGEEITKAVEVGIPFSADMRRAEKIYVNRGEGLPQQQVYDPRAESIMNGALYQYIFDTIARHKSPAKIIVLTCGAGNICLELARLGHEVRGIDISERVIKVARRFAEENPFKETFGSLTYDVADLNTIEFEPDSTDVVLAWDGLHHILMLERLLDQVKKALKSDGLFIFSDNIGMQRRSRVLGGLLYLLLPTHVSYITKIKYAFGGEKKIKSEMSTRSPFEEMHTDIIMDVAQRHFQIVEKKYHTGIGYRAAIAGDMRCPGLLKYPFLRALKAFDDWAVKWGLLKGDHVLVLAQAQK